MNRLMVAMVALWCAVACYGKAGDYRVVSRRATQKSAFDRLKSNRQGFPYEVRVDRETVPGKSIHWYSDGHSVTVTPWRVDCTALTNTVDAAVIKDKRHKRNWKNASKHDAKNLEKAVSELRKLMEKSSGAVAPLYQDAIDIFEGR